MMTLIWLIFLYPSPYEKGIRTWDTEEKYKHSFIKKFDLEDRDRNWKANRWKEGLLWFSADLLSIILTIITR